FENVELCKVRTILGVVFAKEPVDIPVFASAFDFEKVPLGSVRPQKFLDHEINKWIFLNKSCRRSLDRCRLHSYKNTKSLFCFRLCDDIIMIFYQGVPSCR